MATGTSIPAVPVGIAPPLRIVLESVRTALADHEKRLQEKERELRTLRELLKAQTAAGDGVVLLDETMPAVTNYQMRQHPNHVMYVLPALPFVLLAGNPVPQRVIAQLYRGLEDDNSTVLSLVDETQGLALEDHPPAGVRYRYFLRFRAPDYSKSGPMTPPEGIAFTNVQSNPEIALPPGEGGVFLETFEQRDLLTKWPNVSGTSPVIDFPENGLFGGIVARIAGAQWWGVHRDLIPYDPNTLYRITAGVKRTVAGNGQGHLYIGVVGVASDGETLINRLGSNDNGTQHYVAANNQLPAVGTYTEYSGYFKGLGGAPFNEATSPASPTPLYTGVRFIRPLAIVNYTGGTGTTEIDYIRIDALTPWMGWTPVVTNGGGASMLVTGTEIRKSGGIAAWDSQVYSRESYAAGCALSFRPLQNNADFGIGLNTDPTTDASYTSIDYWIDCSAAGIFSIWESGATQSFSGANTYDTSTTFSITYDGVYVRYLKNGTVVREVYDVGQRFYLDSSWYAPGAAAAAIQFIPLTTTRPVAFIPRGNCRVSDTNIIKQGGAAAWDSDCYSIVGYPVCHVTWKANSATVECGVGLTTDPTADQNYTSIDYWLDISSNGSWVIYENGTSTGVTGAYTAADVFAITYDGATVTYWKNNVSLRTVAVAGLTLFMDSSFYSPGSGINSLRFGPTTNLAVADTAQIGNGAATSVFTVFDAGPINVNNIA